MLKLYLKELLILLDAGNYKTAKTISEQLEISEKTVRIRMKELNNELQQYGASIESRPRHGFLLVIHDSELYNQLEKNIDENMESSIIPDSSGERVSFLLVYLLNKDGYIKMDKLSEFLYISKSTVTAALRQVEVIVEQYRIKIERRPNYGIRLIGDEMDFRRCLGEVFIKRDTLLQINTSHKEKELERVAKIVLVLLRDYKIKLSETAFENFISYVYAAKERFARGKFVELKRTDIMELNDYEWEFVKALSISLGQEFNIIYTEAEQAYIALHLAGKRMVGSGERDEVNFVIRSDIDQLVIQMLENIYMEFKIDFRNAFDLRMSLNQHMVPFDIRMRYDIPLSNPMLSDIKNNYKFAYWIAAVASSVLEKHYRKKIPEEETGYLALSFALALEKQNAAVDRKNILIVCGSGKGSSRLLKYKYQQEFKDYLDEIYVCDLMELESFDFTIIEYVITTVTILIHIPVPIIEVGLFLEERDILNVKKVLASNKLSFLEKYYEKNAFLNEIQGSTKNEVLRFICEKIMTDKNIPEDIYQLVLDREEFGTTDYGNLVAIPHPIKSVTKDSYVYVAVLKEPIPWGNNDVQVIFLTVIGNQFDPKLEKFYEATLELIQDQNAIAELIKKHNYETLMELLKKQNR